ncbi:MAG: hypothetical protein HY900_17870 [Deltaproteobacteria bacterium]|nr:hypothetical protein [Deltaproteobacteria bacterium]
MPSGAGNVLFVDLTDGSFRREELPKPVRDAYLSGHGVNYWLVDRHSDVRAVPLSAENPVVLGTGLFNGTPVPGSSQLFVTTRFPLTGSLATACGGGHFAGLLRSCGYDYVFLTGASPEPVYLLLEDDGPRLLDARDLWGKDNFDTVDALRARHEPCSVIPIGPAGENLVKVSVTAIDKLGTVGAGGLPAVLGFKRLKAIVATRGSAGVAPANGKELLRLTDELVRKVLGYELRDRIVEGGAAAATAGWRASGQGFLSQELVRGVLDEHRACRKALACPSCPVADKESVCFSEGPFAGLKTYVTAFMGLEETHGSEDPREMLQRAFKLHDAANRWGLDEHQVGPMLQLLTRLSGEGKIAASSELEGGFASRLELLDRVAHRRGLGDLLADGVDEALRRLGLFPGGLSATVKSFQAKMEPRLNALGTMEFGMLVNPRGAVPVSALGSPSYNPGRPVEQFVRQAERVGIPPEAQERIFGGGFNPARLVRYAEDWLSLHNTLGLCHRLYISRFHSLSGVTALYNALTGEQRTGAELYRAAERAWNLWRHLNARLGFSAKHDQPPRVWFKPLRIGEEEFRLEDYYRTKVLTEPDVHQLLRDYYDERGWDPRTGNPGPEKLRELGI